MSFVVFVVFGFVIFCAGVSLHALLYPKPPNHCPAICPCRAEETE